MLSLKLKFIATVTAGVVKTGVSTDIFACEPIPPYAKNAF